MAQRRTLYEGYLQITWVWLGTVAANFLRDGIPISEMQQMVGGLAQVSARLQGLFGTRNRICTYYIRPTSGEDVDLVWDGIDPPLLDIHSMRLFRRAGNLRQGKTASR